MIGHNSLGFTFGGFAQATWAGSWDIATKASGDFLFRLGPGAGPVAYRPTGKTTFYQGCDSSKWPEWGEGDLSFGHYDQGYHGVLGENGYCSQGPTYAGPYNDACGGNANWGATEMEVWYRVGS
eukprot:COSAG05_NODE_3126_length_2304_cov_2.452608_3_plen_124_part_00